MQKAFSLIELIFVIVIIGILAAVAVPKFRGLSQNSKISAELATASTIQSAIDDVHSQWITADESFTWGNGKTEADLNKEGYPAQLGDCPPAFNWILKNSSTVDAKWSCRKKGAIYIYRGPASSPNSNVKENGPGKPDSNDAWIYDPKKGTFELQENYAS